MITRWFGSLSICYDAVAGTSIQWFLNDHSSPGFVTVECKQPSKLRDEFSQQFMNDICLGSQYSQKKQRACQNQHKNGFRTGFLISNFTIQFAILARLLIRFFSRKKSYWKKYFSSLSKVGSWSSGVIHASSQAVQDLVDQSLQRWLGWMIGILTWMVQFFYYSPTFSRQGIYIGKMSLHNMPQIHRWNLPNKKMQMVVIPLLRFGAFLWWWWFVVWPPHLYILYSPIIPNPPQSHQTRTKSQGSIEGFGGHGIIPLRGRRMARGKVSLFVELVGEGSHWRIIVVSNSN